MSPSQHSNTRRPITPTRPRERFLLVLVVAMLPAAGNFTGGLVAEFFNISERALSLALHLAAGNVGKLDGRTSATQIARYCAGPTALDSPDVLGEPDELVGSPRRRAAATARVLQAAKPGEWVDRKPSQPGNARTPTSRPTTSNAATSEPWTTSAAEVDARVGTGPDGQLVVQVTPLRSTTVGDSHLMITCRCR